MRRLVFCAAAFALAFAAGVPAFAQSQPRAPAEQNAPRHFDSQASPQGDRTLSERLDRSGGVISPPAHVDPDIHVTPPATGDKMPVVPPPGSRGGDPNVTPK
jgi:hypothetical protein